MSISIVESKTVRYIFTYFVWNSVKWARLTTLHYMFTIIIIHYFYNLHMAYDLVTDTSEYLATTLNHLSSAF